MSEIQTGVVTVITSTFAFIGGLVVQLARTKRHQTASAGEALESIISGMEAQRAELLEARREHHECLERATRLEVRLARVESRVGMPRYEASAGRD